jgi:hypothetical protein
MNRANAWYVGGGVLFVAWAAFMSLVPQPTNPAFDFIAGNRPVTEDQVRQKFVSDGWMDVQIALRGRYFVPRHGKMANPASFPSTH